MAKYFDVHPDNPQPRMIGQVVDLLRAGGLIAYPTDSCFALGCQLGNRDGIDRIRTIRHLDDRHHFTLVCQDFAQLGQFVHIDNAVFRAIKAATPGSYTFILPATKEVPRRLLHPKKKTVGVRIPDHVVAQALLAELGEPLLSSTLLLPDEDEPMTQGWEIKERLDHLVDAVIDSGDCGTEPTTVIDFSERRARDRPRSARATPRRSSSHSIRRGAGSRDAVESSASRIIASGIIRADGIVVPAGEPSRTSCGLSWSRPSGKMAGTHLVAAEESAVPWARSISLCPRSRSDGPRKGTSSAV